MAELAHREYQSGDYEAAERHCMQLWIMTFWKWLGTEFNANGFQVYWNTPTCVTKAAKMSAGGVEWTL